MSNTILTPMSPNYQWMLGNYSVINNNDLIVHYELCNNYITEGCLQVIILE